MKFRRYQLVLIFVAVLIANWAIVWLSQRDNHTVFAKEMDAVVAAPEIATIPNAFSYQGSLRLADGSLATGSYDVTLKLYNTMISGSALYTETFTSTVVRNGNFSVIVGDVTPIAATIFNNAKLYIGITVAPDPEMLPRQRLYPVPWAIQASQAAIHCCHGYHVGPQCNSERRRDVRPWRWGLAYLR